MTNTPNPRSPTSMDKIIGERIRSARENAGYSQQELAGLLRISFQQLQKYERGLNRVSVSRFLTICEALKVFPTTILTGLYFIGDDDLDAAGIGEGAD